MYTYPSHTLYSLWLLLSFVEVCLAVRLSCTSLLTLVHYVPLFVFSRFLRVSQVQTGNWIREQRYFLLILSPVPIVPPEPGYVAKSPFIVV